MTDEQVAIAKALDRASLPLASNVKDFVGKMAWLAEHHQAGKITEKQDVFLRQLAYRFRRQMPAGLFGEPTKLKGNITVLQWLGPEMARSGLLKNEGWVTAAADEAEALFPNQALRTAAVMIAVLHPCAIDYINQAPVLVLAVTQGSKTYEQKERQLICEKLKPLIERGPKLRELLGAFGVPVQLRALRSWALGPSKWKAVKAVAKIPPSTLAQSIPEKPKAQSLWLGAVGGWTDVMDRRFNDRYRLLEWAVMRFKEWPLNWHETIATSLADFAGTVGAGFNERWDLRQAQERCEQWHAMLASQSAEQQFVTKHGVGWRDKIDYGHFPEEFGTSDGLRVVALRTGEDVFLEGQAMHHCVASYADDVVRGRCRLFSVRRGDDRLATVELVLAAPAHYVIGGASMHGQMWGISQMKGPCNADPPKSVKTAMVEFLKSAGGTDVTK
jgi:hypothetical protein